VRFARPRTCQGTSLRLPRALHLEPFRLPQLKAERCALIAPNSTRSQEPRAGSPRQRSRLMAQRSQLNAHSSTLTAQRSQLNAHSSTLTAQRSQLTAGGRRLASGSPLHNSPPQKFRCAGEDAFGKAKVGSDAECFARQMARRLGRRQGVVHQLREVAPVGRRGIRQSFG